MRKKILLVFILIVGLFPIVAGAEELREKHANNPNEIFINDTTGVFTREQLEEVKATMLPLLDKGNVMLLVRRSAGERSIDLVAQEEYHKTYNDQSGAIVVINIYNGADSDGDNEDWHNNMTIFGFGNIVITDTQRNIIFETNRSSIQKAEFVTAAKGAFDSICEFNNIKKYEKESVNSSTIDKVILEDDADLLTTEDEAKLIDAMTPLTEYGYIVFKTINSNDLSTKAYAENYYYKNFGNQSGTMFLIDMANRNIYICSAGNNYKFITKDKADIITDNTYKYASNKDYYGCALEAFTEMKTILDGGKIAEPMRYASNIVLSLVIGFLLTFAFVASSMTIKRSSKSKKIETLGKAVTIAGVNVICTGQHSVYSPVSDSGSGSGFSGGGGGGFSGGGGGGGGGFSGGGGGHSF